MGAFEVIGSNAKTPSTTFTELKAFTGQTFTVRATTAGAALENMWAMNATGGSVRIRSPRMHDNTQGIRMRVPKALVQPLVPYSVKEVLYPTDVLVPETTGGAAEEDQAYFLLHYDDIPGSNANVRTWAEVKPMINQYMGVEVSPKSGAAVTEWGAPVALNASMDLFKRPLRYAILGYTLDTQCGAVVLSGIEPGQLKFGGPGTVDPDYTGEWFVNLSHETGQPAIPIFDSQNVGSVNVEVGSTEISKTVNITFLCAQLRG